MPPTPQDQETFHRLREEIDALDDALVDVVCRRARAVAEIRALKARMGLPFLDPGREARILDRAAARVEPPMREEPLREILACVLARTKEALGQSL